MSQETALAQPQAQPLAKSLIRDLAQIHGVDEKKFYAAVKVAAGCKGALDEHFMVLLMQAEKYGLDPLSSPPQLQLLDVGNGPQVYARLDAYKSFLHRAEAAGKVEWRKYEECWLPDPASPPEKPTTARAGKVTMKLKSMPEPVVKIVWWREWSGKGQWSSRGSHMLEGRAWKEACRDWLGFFMYDEDDAQQIRGDPDEPRRVDAEVTDAIRPSIPIAGLQRPALPPPAAEPFTIDVPRSEPVEAAQGKPTEGGPVTAVSQPPSDAATTASSGRETSASPAPSTDFDEAESRRLDAEEAERQKKGELFS